jgi:hypothetical protein
MNAAPASAARVLTLTRADTRIVIQAGQRGVSAQGAPRHVRFKVERTLADQLQRAFAAEQVMEIDRDDIRYYVVLSQEMSRPLAMGRGYCGAGEEHKLLLIASRGNTLRQSDSLLISSCLESFGPRTPDGQEDSTRAALDIDAQHDAIRFRWLEDEPDTERILSIQHGRFVLELHRRHPPAD